MKRFWPLAAATMAVATLCGAVPASAAKADLPPPSAALRVSNLHAAFERALSHASPGRIGGVVPVRGRRIAQPRPHAVAACAEPNCNLNYSGGPVQHSPHVYLLLWGPNWSISSPAYNDLYYLYSGLGVSPQDTWSTTTSQYADSGGSPAFTGSVFMGAFKDTSAPPSQVTPDDLAAEADAFSISQNIIDVADAQVVVASQSGTCFSDGFAGNSCSSSGQNGYCGWHSMTNSGLPFINLPYQLDAGVACGENFVNAGAAGTYDGFSMIAGHEYAETITDPEPGTGWIDGSDAISGGEIADKCVWGGSNWGSVDPFGDVTLSTGSFAMQSLWSNALGQCVLTTSPVLTLSAPATQKSTLGVAVRVQIHATSNVGALSYKAVGLPPGLSISGSGRIAGTPAVTAGTFKPAVTVSNYAGSKTVSFSWQVSSRPGAIKGYHNTCVDDYNGRTANGTKIDIWSCDGQTRQRVSFTATGELVLSGKCITSGRGVTLATCTGSASQTWRRRSNGEYIVQGRCLTDPRNSTRNGTQLQVSSCTDSPDQRWSLP